MGETEKCYEVSVKVLYRERSGPGQRMGAPNEQASIAFHTHVIHKDGMPFEFCPGKKEVNKVGKVKYQPSYDPNHTEDLPHIEVLKASLCRLDASKVCFSPCSACRVLED